MAGVTVLSSMLTAAVFIATSSAFLINTASQTPLKVASFNIKHFGRGVMSNATVANQIVQILQRYDVALIMETRDASGTALVDLWNLLNKTDEWGLIQSDPVGRAANYKEQYVFVYRAEKARWIASTVIPDSSDIYEREPYVVEFEYYSVTPGANRRVAFLGLHTRPDDTIAELDELPNSIKYAASHFSSVGGVIAMGDFNVDCRYASGKKRGDLVIFKGGEFTSLIDDSADTTSGDSDCAYDRVIVYGSDVRAREAKVYNYQTAMGLTDAQAEEISDHYPIEFKLF